MPGRKTILATGEYYHVFNRGIDRRPTFTRKREFQRALECMRFYCFQNTPIKLSQFLILSNERREEILSNLITSEKLVDIVAYCFMPNHFHFLLKQNVDKGISKFLSDFQNSYTRYFNVKHQRDGALFLDQFKAVHIETQEQLLHVSRYIHLNPYVAFICNSFEELEKYPWSSLPFYFNKSENIVQNEDVLSFFKSTKEYQKFVFDQADYQRNLKKIDHLVFE